ALRGTFIINPEGIIKTAEEVARFCEEPALRVSLDSFKAEFAYLTGRREDALRMQEEVVMRMLLSHGVGDETTYLQVFNLASALLDRRRLHDARRVTGAALALAEDANPRWRALPLLRCMLGLLCVELGELDRGVGLMHRGLAQLPDVEPPVNADTIRFQRSHLERAQLLSGALSLAELLARRDYAPWAFFAATLQALWREDPACLQTLRPSLAARIAAGDATARMVYGAAMYLGRGKSALRAFDRLCEDAVVADPALFQRFTAAALRAQLAHRAGAPVAETAQNARHALEALGPRVTPLLELRAIHFRTLRRLGERDGDEFFHRHLGAGYLWLRAPA
ncbi:MAG: hypothetical protein KJ044_04875, partial [Planctomycetes bacterium]|nr:hypothetical protein [Planctomycetota bacterium]